MANVEDFLESINYAPVDVRRNFHLIKDLQAMEERLEKLLCGKQHQMKILMEMDNSREKDVLLQGLKEDIQRLHLQLLALHRERINAAETVQLMFQKYSKQLDSEFEKFIDELRSLPQEQDDGLIRKSTREIVKQDNYVKTGVVSKKRKPDVDIITEDPQNKPYCICQRPSYGVMVACDNSVCRIEWFHMDCVGLVELPLEKQKWFCPDCDGSRNIL